MTLKGGAEFKGKLTRGLKNDIRNLLNFHASSLKSENLQFDGFLLSKAYKVWDGKVQKSYASWHWRVMQSLKKKRLLVPKMTWGICWILLRTVASLKIWTLMCYFCWKRAEELCVTTMKNDGKFNEELTCAFKRDMRNLANFDPTLERLKVCTLMGSFWLKYIMFEP